ncbi:MAG TPA: fibrobacter succinogenes major paralogous domain-containing protein [Bacteroidales bacterium]|nr:fibrobacter succinogenes major paralogous domain-containing protein [Bacteroidales bacterium]HNS45972.1 fibrobacter succinogenes major paralogous domain-containing protein [Bacteroidales bacterium]
MKKTDRIWLLSLILMMGAAMMFTISCKEEEEEELNPPKGLKTSAVTGITIETASCGGEVTDEGGSAVTARGVCWSTVHLPCIGCNTTVDGAGTGTFKSSLTGLASNTNYYVRTYATNLDGTSYGNEVTFRTEGKTPTGLTTSAVTRITDETASCGGAVSDEGGFAVTARGVCWCTATSPSIMNSKTSDGADTGIFVSSITGLAANTTYYVRTYATNSEGTSYGNEVTFTTPPTVTDIDGNVYHTVIIGDQVWMAENLRVTHYRDGSSIHYISNDAYSNQEWMQCTIGAYCIAKTGKYGVIYNAYAAMDERNLAPAGWHIPSDAEWKILEGTVDSQYPVDDPQWDNYAYRGFDAGGNLKSTTSDWNQPNSGATDKFGFSALPGGWRSSWDNGKFMEESISAVFATSTPYGASDVWGRSIRYEESGIYRPYAALVSGVYVRCVKD